MATLPKATVSVEALLPISSINKFPTHILHNHEDRAQKYPKNLFPIHAQSNGLTTLTTAPCSFAEALIGKEVPRASVPAQINCQEFDYADLKAPTSILGSPAILFDLTAKASMVSKYQYTLIGKFSHGKPTWKKLTDFFKQLNLKSECKVSIFDHKHLYIVCSNRTDFYRIWLRLVWNVDGCPMRVFRWEPQFNAFKESSIAPVWIRFEGLPLYMFDQMSLLNLSNAIGRPICIDPRNLNGTMLNSARVCVELDVSKPLIDLIKVGFVQDVSNALVEEFSVQVIYDVVPSFCCSCWHIGHSQDKCKRSTATSGPNPNHRPVKEMDEAPVSATVGTASTVVMKERGRSRSRRSIRSRIRETWVKKVAREEPPKEAAKLMETSQSVMVANSFAPLVGESTNETFTQQLREDDEARVQVATQFGSFSTALDVLTVLEAENSDQLTQIASLDAELVADQHATYLGAATSTKRIDKSDVSADSGQLLDVSSGQIAAQSKAANLVQSADLGNNRQITQAITSNYREDPRKEWTQVTRKKKQGSSKPHYNTQGQALNICNNIAMPVQKIIVSTKVESADKKGVLEQSECRHSDQERANHLGSKGEQIQSVSVEHIVHNDDKSRECITLASVVVQDQNSPSESGCSKADKGLQSVVVLPDKEAGTSVCVENVEIPDPKTDNIAKPGRLAQQKNASATQINKNRPVGTTAASVIETVQTLQIGTAADQNASKIENGHSQQSLIDMEQNSSRSTATTLELKSTAEAEIQQESVQNKRHMHQKHLHSSSSSHSWADQMEKIDMKENTVMQAESSTSLANHKLQQLEVQNRFDGLLLEDSEVAAPSSRWEGLAGEHVDTAAADQDNKAIVLAVLPVLAEDEGQSFQAEETGTHQGQKEVPAGPSVVQEREVQIYQTSSSTWADQAETEDEIADEQEREPQYNGITFKHQEGDKDIHTAEKVRYIDFEKIDVFDDIIAPSKPGSVPSSPRLKLSRRAPALDDLALIHSKDDSEHSSTHKLDEYPDDWGADNMEMEPTLSFHNRYNFRVRKSSRKGFKYGG